MKKRNNKVIILTIVAIIFMALFGIFIATYSKDDYSFTMLEKKWINDNTSNIIDVSIYNDVPVYGKNGKGVAFDILDEFTKSYDIKFNKVSYSIKNNVNFKDVAFKILDINSNISEKDILLYEDNYVLVSKNNDVIDRITDISDIKVAVFTEDMTVLANLLYEANNVSYLPKKNIDEIKKGFEDEEVSYALIPYNLYIDFILENDMNVLYKFTDISKKYVLTSKNDNFRNIFRKYYLRFRDEYNQLSYKENFLAEFFLDKDISEVERMGYNENPYTVGYITYMPFEDSENNEFVGTLSNYLGGFEDVFNVDLKLVSYDNIADLKKAFSAGELDLVFGNFNVSGLNIDTISTKSLFKEEYVVLSRDIFAISSIKSLKDKKVITVKDSFIHSMLLSNNINCVALDNTDELLRNVDNESVVVIDKATYDYYKVRKFSEHNELYRGVLPYQYSFLIRDVNKNAILAEMFTHYVDMVNYDTVKFDYNTKIDNYS